MTTNNSNRTITAKKVLIVEDELLAAKLLQQIIAQAGYHCVGIAKNAEEALDLAKNHLPDIVLMDILLQGDIDGITTAHKIRKFLNSPIIYVSSYSDSETIIRALQVHNSAYITKPFSQDHLLLTIQEIFNKLTNENN